MAAPAKAAQDKSAGFLWGTLLVMVGCGLNNLVLEYMVETSRNPDADRRAGILLTPVQFVFVILASLPEVLNMSGKGGFLRAPAMPLGVMLLQVLLHAPMSHLNNIAFAFGKVSQVLHVVVRSAGGVASMVIGWALFTKRYSLAQVTAMLLATGGAVLIAVAERFVHAGDAAAAPGCCGDAPTPEAAATAALAADEAAAAAADGSNTPAWMRSAAAGEAVLVVVLVLAAFLTHLQSSARKRYPGASAGETLFWLHIMGVVMLLGAGSDAAPAAVRGGEEGMLAKAQRWASSRPFSALVDDVTGAPGWSSVLGPAGEAPCMLVLAVLNGLTQVFCIRGVTMLVHSAEPVMVTLVMTARKAVTWALSVVLFGHPTIWLHYVAAGAVFIGVAAYAQVPGPSPLPAAAVAHAKDGESKQPSRGTEPQAASEGSGDVSLRRRKPATNAPLSESETDDDDGPARGVDGTVVR
ncbi:hypothetical protein FNF29_05312 [Cafeteria roenbergensis]|uniref:Sugar phosphate transporter domain-containing protein n=1 Tax=Cafeteria roenbergensis TaxID=33653 RepID=A0A5A8DQN0_CAFRO|nr:hypothetical protein FNF29_05312 [Cafeteria roenbergensis]KAA0151955.1 hypothetical protein FNF31_06715 [Cafeteria roenbergensis]KAA0166937.1 hypothetical protein FNF28_03008 [Cafeteria roenbergensis]|eukprot:KAA0150299.1 hypothetical protein FNF29_05312 [Cafeteria roenbergensis]